ncbi:MAG: response regulator, partial [Desulfobacteraceae bacterium]|nr:response regulator [Desulfobacteraceae bacterium]
LFLFGLIVVFHLWGKKEWPFWVFVFFLAIIWPHIAYFIGIKSKDPVKIECFHQQMEAFLTTFFISVCNFSLWPSMTFVVGSFNNVIATGGLRLFVKTIPFYIGGFIAEWAIYGLKFSPHDASLLTSFASMAFLMAYTMLVAFSSHQYARRLKMSKKAVKDANRIVKDKLEKLVADRTRELTDEINERIEIEKMLNKAMVQAKAAAQAKIEFLANMSHEIRTPINGIMGMIELVLEDETDDDRKEIFKTIDTEAGQLLEIINEILDFSKIEAGKLSIEEIEFNLRKNFEQTCSSLAVGINDKGIEFISFLSPEVPANLIGDPGRLRQILVNLASNAIKFTNSGEIFIKGELIKETKTNVEVRFQVRDTGIGIAKENQETIFESFSQADGSTTRKYGGTGLGTTISSQLVALMGGKIGLESELDKGSTFWFTLPFAKQKHLDESKEKAEYDLNGLKVLVIDENQTNRYIFDQYLRSFGCIPFAAQSPQNGLDLLENNSSIDVVIVNYKMSGMDGFEFAKTIKEFDKLSKIPIILLTSMPKQGDGILCKDIGINGYLLKPVKKEVLRTVILKVLGKVKNKVDEKKELVTRHTIAEDKAKNIRILLVEDYPTNQKIVIRYLTSVGYQVVLAENGVQAVDMFKQKHFDLILMDIQMPEMDGYEATLLIREYESQLSNNKSSGAKNEQHSSIRIPIIAMTAHAIKGYKKKCLDAGMDDYITKPIRKIDFLEIVEKSVSRADRTN